MLRQSDRKATAAAVQAEIALQLQDTPRLELPRELTALGIDRWHMSHAELRTHLGIQTTRKWDLPSPISALSDHLKQGKDMKEWTHRVRPTQGLGLHDLRPWLHSLDTIELHACWATWKTDPPEQTRRGGQNKMNVPPWRHET